MKAYPLAVHLNGIAVDHRGRTGRVGQGGRGEQEEGDSEGVHHFRGYNDYTRGLSYDDSIYRQPGQGE